MPGRTAGPVDPWLRLARSGSAWLDSLKPDWLKPDWLKLDWLKLDWL